MARADSRWIFGSIAWLCAIVAGFAVLLRYETSAGQQSGAPATWPSGSAIVRGPDRPTLLMFVHPRCTCSRASMTELRKLMQRVDGKVEAHVLFMLPNGTSEGWEGSALREIARSIPGVVLSNDLGSVEAARFSAATSGISLLYDAAGHLQFQGGITSLRGHEGDSFGQERIVALVNQRSADRRDSPVFGCLLADKPAMDGAR